MELLLLLYAMLAGLAGVSGQSPARAQEVAVGSNTPIEAVDTRAHGGVSARAVASIRADRALAPLRAVADARLVDVPLTVLALVPLARQAPERRLE